MKNFLLSGVYAKGKIALGGFLGQLVILSVDGHLTLADYLAALVAGLTAAGVIAVANKET